MFDIFSSRRAYVQRDGPGAWAGAVLCAPMVKIADKMKPHRCVISILRMVEKLAPTLQVTCARTPAQDAA